MVRGKAEECRRMALHMAARYTVEKGFTYLWVIFIVAMTGITLAAAGQVWRTEAQREKEKELMFVGNQFRHAIGSYYESSPGMRKRYPDSLEKLLSDDRFPTVKRHLRKVFLDPMTGGSEWGLIREPGAGIVGVHSLSTRAPLKRANFPERYATFDEAENYRDWKFIYLPGDLAPVLPQPQEQPERQRQPPTDSKQQTQVQPETEQQPDQQPQSQTQPESSRFPVFPSPSFEPGSGSR